MADTNIVKILDNEYLHRARRASSTYADASDPANLSSNSDAKTNSTRPKIRLKYSPNDSAAARSEEGLFKRANLSSLEIFLIVVLVLITAIIFLEIWVAANPDVFDSMWQIIREFLSP